MTATILNLFRPPRKPRAEDIVLDRAREEVRRVREVLELRSTAPTYVYRGHCEDCDGSAVLIDGLTCDVCGSRSVVLISKGWVGKKKPDWRDEVAA